MQSELVIVEDAPLTEDEEGALSRCEQTIERGLQTFYEVGEALLTIRTKRLYRKDHRSFEEYCQERWEFTKTYANYQIAAAEVRANLTTMVVNTRLPFPLPTTERQARPLTRLEPEQQIGAWVEAVARSGGPPTGGMVEQVVREWIPDDQNVFTDPQADEYEAVIEERKSRFNEGMRSSETPEWYTPVHIITRVIQMFGQIDLDPCSNSHEAPNVPALNHYTANDNGLAQPWHGRVYMNPPYGDEIPAWVERMIQAYQDSEIAEGIALLPGRIDTAWFRPLWDYAICAIYGRLRFSNAENSAPFPSVVVYMGRDVEGFKDAFSDIGKCGQLR